MALFQAWLLAAALGWTTPGVRAIEASPPPQTALTRAYTAWNSTATGFPHSTATGHNSFGIYTGPTATPASAVAKSPQTALDTPTVYASPGFKATETGGLDTPTLEPIVGPSPVVKNSQTSLDVPTFAPVPTPTLVPEHLGPADNGEPTVIYYSPVTKQSQTGFGAITLPPIVLATPTNGPGGFITLPYQAAPDSKPPPPADGSNPGGPLASLLRAGMAQPSIYFAGPPPSNGGNRPLVIDGTTIMPNPSGAAAVVGETTYFLSGTSVFVNGLPTIVAAGGSGAYGPGGVALAPSASPGAPQPLIVGGTTDLPGPSGAVVDGTTYSLAGTSVFVNGVVTSVPFGTAAGSWVTGSLSGAATATSGGSSGLVTASWTTGVSTTTTTTTTTTGTGSETMVTGSMTVSVTGSTTTPSAGTQATSGARGSVVARSGVGAVAFLLAVVLIL